MLDCEAPTCSVCMDFLLTDIATTRCGHVFHRDCILKSLETKATCPICRAKCPAKSLVALTMTISKRREDSPGEDNTEVARLYRALEADVKARRHLEGELAEMAAKLCQARQEVHFTELNNVDLRQRCETLRLSLESAQVREEVLRSEVKGEQHARKQTEETIRKLQLYAQAVSEANSLPSVKRAAELMADSSLRDKADALFAHVILLSQQLEQERKENAHLKNILETSENELKEVRCRLHMLKQTHKPQSNPLLSPQEFEVDQLRKVAKVTRGRPSLLPPQ